MNHCKVVKYVDPKMCLRKIRIKPTPEQEYEILKVARATNELFVKLLEIVEFVSDKYRKTKRINRMVCDHKWVCSQVSKLKKDYPELKSAWSSSQDKIAIKVCQRNWDRVQGIGYIDELFGKDKIKVYKHKKRREFRWIQRLSERYDEQITFESNNFQIPINLNPKIFDIRKLKLSEYKKGCIKTGRLPAIIKTADGPKLYLPKMKKGIDVVPNGLRKFSGSDIKAGNLAVYLECIRGDYYITFYEFYDNLTLPLTGMPRYVRTIREEQSKKSDIYKSFYIQNLINSPNGRVGIQADFDDFDDFDEEDEYERDEPDRFMYDFLRASKTSVVDYFNGVDEFDDEDDDWGDEEDEDDWDEDEEDEEDDGFIHLTYTSTFIEEMTRHKK